MALATMTSVMGVSREEGSGLTNIGQGLKGKAGTREEEVSRRHEVFRGSLGESETTGEEVAVHGARPRPLSAR